MDVFEDEVIGPFITDLREKALSEYRQGSSERQQVYRSHTEHSVEKERVLRELPAAQRQVLEEYMEQNGDLISGEMDYLYVRGIQDGIKLMRILGVL